MRILYRIKLALYNRLDWQIEESFFASLKNICSFRKVSRGMRIKTISETINALNFSDSSMARFGDGEIKVIFGGGNEFQKPNNALAKRLKEILISEPKDNMIICIPNIREYQKAFNKSSLWFWNGFIRKYGKQLATIFTPPPHIEYGSAAVTRFYLEVQDKTLCADYFCELKRIWEGKRLLIVEGNDTKFGIGNDLIKNAVSIKRIICPSRDAFTKYDAILKSVVDHYNGELVLIALGMTATVLAYDLQTKYNIRALDIGHLDIEYEWFIRGSCERMRIQGKHTAEMPDEYDDLPKSLQKVYEKQIVSVIY